MGPTLFEFVDPPEPATATIGLLIEILEEQGETTEAGLEAMLGNCADAIRMTVAREQKRGNKEARRIKYARLEEVHRRVSRAARGDYEMPQNVWRVGFKKSSGSWEGPIVAYWEVANDPISDDYAPDETSAEELLQMWARRVAEAHPDGLIPIYWFVASEEAAKFEMAPFGYDHFKGKHQLDDFLTLYDWPMHATTNEPLNWLTLPVADKLWRKGRADKGGFIQEATGWKPSILQPYVYLPSLLKGVPTN